MSAATPTLRADPASIHSTLKEAVVDSLLNLTYAQVSGAGATGERIFGARPRMLLNSGFLLPQREPSGDDEVTSPIWISSHGLQMQLTTAPGIVTVEPRVSVYVRVLPSEDDIKRPGCQPTLILRKEVEASLRATRNGRLEAEWERVKGEYTSKAKHPGWAAIRERVIDEVYAERNIPRRMLSAIPASEETPATAEAIEAAEGEAPPEGVVVAEGTPVALIRDEHFEPLAVPHKWHRLDVTLPTLELNLAGGLASLQETLEAHAAAMNAAVAGAIKIWSESDDPAIGGKDWGYRRLVSVPASQYKSWPLFLENVRKSSLLPALPLIELGWDFALSDDWLDPTKRNFFLALENISETPTQHQDETEEAVFLVSLRLELPVALHHPLRLERIEPSYRFNRYLTYPALGHNGGVVRLPDSVDKQVLETTWHPRYVQPRIVPTNVAGVQRRVRLLSQPDSLDLVSPIVVAMQDWIDTLPAHVDPSAGLLPGDADGVARESKQFKDDIQKWQRELDAVKTGLAILAESRAAWSARGAPATPAGLVYEAWLAMNEAMADFMEARFKNNTSEWRLFQLAFIIANIPALASRVPDFQKYFDAKRDDAVTLLYFATGGGKSEAFFGLLVFNLFLDRLRGKSTGVTTLIRYPLRLLTIQQAQRCARVLAHAEVVRKVRAYGGAPFSIGFWVGSGGSPNRHSVKGMENIPEVTAVLPTPEKETRLVDDDPKYAAALRAWRKLPSCPFCGASTALRRFVSATKEDQTLGHVCTNSKCSSNEGFWQALPFYIVDEDIYDLAPSVLLGTVDKLALIGHSGKTIRRIFGMFGAAPWIRPTSGRLYVPDAKELAAGPSSRGMVGLAPAYKGGPVHFHDPFPSLIIQDEAHLLDESLGTFAGLFESTLDAVFAHLAKPLKALVATDADGKRRRTKVIAASATVAEPQRQLEHLYQRSIPATQFPEPGPSLYDSFYAEPQKADATEPERQEMVDVEVSSRQARLYTAFMTNGKPHTATSVAVLSGFHLVITRVFDGLASGDATAVNTAKELLAGHVSGGPLEQLHRAKLLAAGASELATAVDLHRIALTYVTNKKGGDQIMAAEAEETRKKHLNEEIPLDSIDTRLITGSVEQGEVQAVVADAQFRVPAGSTFPPLREQLRSVIATSAISHGVDVDEFNSMFFAGMPSDIAEYIQASSRVGRTHIGFVVLIPTPQRRRDRHIVHIFDVFHRFLERMVQPAAIDRWAEKAIERVFPSLFQAYLLGVVPSAELITLDLDKKGQTPDYGFIPNVRKEYSVRGAAFLNEINQFIELAVGLSGGFAPDGEAHYRQKIEERTRNLVVNIWGSPLWGSGDMGKYFQGQPNPMLKPMTSLRDVDQGGMIRMSSKDVNGYKQYVDQVEAVMAFVRNGVANNDDAGA